MLVKKSTTSAEKMLIKNSFIGPLLLIQISFCLLLLSGLLCAVVAEVSVSFPGTPWEDKIGANTNRKVQLANNTSQKLDIKGVRFSVPENTAMKTGTMDGSTKLNANDPWNGDRRYDVQLKYATKAGATTGATIKGGGATTKIDWSPYDPQVLVKTRSFADMGDFVDANPVKVEQIDSIIATDAFYDENLYVSDTLGERGPLYGAGFIDTYINQKDSTPETQFQMNYFAKDSYVKVNGEYLKFRPDLMGENDNISWKPKGAGPLYIMGLVAGQELMHVDWQFMASMAFNESMAGITNHGNPGPSNPVNPNGKVVYGSGAYGSNTERGLGTMHFEPPSFGEKAFGTYREFFPYASGSPVGDWKQWFATPGADNGGTTYCSGNSAQVVSSTIINTLFCWKGYEQLFRATDFYAKGIFEKAKDRKIAVKLYMWAWNKGFGSGPASTVYSDPLYDPQITTYEDVRDVSWAAAVQYMDRNLPQMDSIVASQKRSVLNGGECEVMDIPITLDDLAEFLFGNDISKKPVTFAESGTLGKAGLLQHIELTQDERKQLWSDVKTAYNKMKGKAPSGFSDAVSLRYDWLTLLRIVKGYMYPQMFDEPFKPVMLPTPTDTWFTTWVKNHSTENNIPDIPVKDLTFPNLYIDNLDVADNGDFIVELRGGDNVALDIDDSLTAEWSIDPDWKRWMPGKYKSGDKTDAYFTLTIPVDTIKAKFGDKDGKGWVRITDKSGNSTIDTITIGGIPYPKVDSVFMLDNAGDGIGNYIDVHLTKGGAEDADKLEDWEEIKYSWPDQSSFKTATDPQVNINGSILTITDGGYSDGAGLGLLELSYPSKKNYGGDIEDRVGPALTKKANLYPSESADPDTLAITFSEAVEGLSDTKLQLAFSTDKSDSATVQQVKVETFGDDSARYLFDARALTNGNYKWVKMEISGGITDKAPNKNKPLDKNQWVPILDNRAKYPTLDSAWAFDKDGNGTADSVAINLTKSQSANPYELDAYTSLEYSWPGKGSLESAGATELDGKTLSFGDLSNDDGRGLGLLSILYDDMPGAAETDILDRVGPAMLTATLSIEDDSRDKDTLLITVSEELDNIADKGENYTFLVKGTNESKEKCDVERVNATTYKLIYDRDKVIDKDSVNFTTVSPLTDKADNKPMDINQRIKINIIGGKDPKISSAAIFDITGNGRGDSVHVELKLGAAADKYTTNDLIDGAYSWPGFDLNKSLSTGDMENPQEDAFGFYYDSKASTGEGKIRLNFPEDFSPERDIDDRVGPAIDSAICYQVDKDREYDTLVLEVSEALKSNFAEDKKYIILFEQKSDSEGDTITVKQMREKSGDYELLLPKNSVTYGDWVQFVYDSGIEDEVGNRPLDINQKILINVLGSVAPKLSEAAIYDVKGNPTRLDGNGDSIFVKLSLTDDPMALTVDSIKSVEYSWGGDTKSKERDELIRLSEDEFAIVDKSLKGGSGTGSLTISFENDGYTTTGEIKDRVAPVLKSASYFNWSDANDTLHVEFSEDLSKTGSDTPLIKSGDKTLKLRKQSHEGAKVTYSVEGDPELILGDELWIKGGQDVTDSEGNEQETDNNVKIPVSYKRVVLLTEAAFRDTDDRPDGYIDEITLRFDSDLNSSVESLIEDGISLPEHRKLTLDEVIVDDDVVKLYVEQNKEEITPNTAVTDEDKLSLAYGAGKDTLAVLSREAIAIDDKMAPVMLSARFTPVDKEVDGELRDELSITYSEKVSKISTDEPFRFSDASDDDSEYSMELSGDKSGRENVVYINVYRKGNILPGAGDSIWIDESGDIEDEVGRVQGRNTVPVPLVVGKYKRDYMIAVTPTPYDVRYYDDDSVAAIRVLPRTRQLPDNIKVQCVIYDKVGNVVKKVTNEQFAEIDNGSLAHEFIPKNKKGRRLGEGCYYIKFVIETEDSEPTEEQSYLFIKGIQPGSSDDDDEDKEKKKDDE